MSVYVDDMFPCKTNKNWRYNEACHLFADSDEELHEFAVDKLRLKRSWFQNHPRMPHYDLTRSKRLLAVSNGVIEASNKQLREYFRRNDNEDKP